jgi:tetratricopeptide (TPR) repeat protein
MTDVQPQRDEIYHLMAAQEYDAACTTLADIDAYLMAWGYYREVAELRSQLMGKLSEHGEAANATALAECLYQGLDQWDEALQHVRRVENTYKRHLNELALAEAVQLHAHILFEQGEFEEASAMVQENLQRYERSGTHAQVANAYNSFGVFVDAVGKWPEAVAYYEKAQTLFEDLGSDPEVGRVLINRSVAEFFLHGVARALEVCRRGLALCPQQERPQEFAYGMLNMAVYHLAVAQLERSFPPIQSARSRLSS